MVLWLCAAAVGLVVGLLLGGRVQGLLTIRLRAAPVVVLAAVLQLSAGLAPPAWRWPLTLATTAIVGVWLAVNIVGQRRAIGAALAVVLVGWGLNFAVVAANRGMPVSRAAMEQLDREAADGDVTRGNLYKHVALVPSTRLPALADRLPVAFPVGYIISLGDIVMLLGLGALIALTTLSARVEMCRPIPSS